MILSSSTGFHCISFEKHARNARDEKLQLLQGLYMRTT